ncbi:hypothetical protein RDWZM_000794, partial [Blomia tropicalis]
MKNDGDKAQTSTSSSTKRNETTRLVAFTQTYTTIIWRRVREGDIECHARRYKNDGLHFG